MIPFCIIKSTHCKCPLNEHRKSCSNPKAQTLPSLFQGLYVTKPHNRARQNYGNKTVKH